MTPRQWLQSADLEFKITTPRAKVTTKAFVWIQADLNYRLPHGDTGFRLQEKHFRGSLFAPVYKALLPEIEEATWCLLGDLSKPGINTQAWEKRMREICDKRQWLRLFIRRGGLDPQAADKAEECLNFPVNADNLKVQADSDAEQIEALGSIVGRGGYSINEERLRQEIRKLLRSEEQVRPPSPPVGRLPDTLSRGERQSLQRAEESRG